MMVPHVLQLIASLAFVSVYLVLGDSGASACNSTERTCGAEDASDEVGLLARPCRSSIAYQPDIGLTCPMVALRWAGQSLKEMVPGKGINVNCDGGNDKDYQLVWWHIMAPSDPECKKPIQNGDTVVLLSFKSQTYLTHTVLGQDNKTCSAGTYKFFLDNESPKTEFTVSCECDPCIPTDFSRSCRVGFTLVIETFEKQQKTCITSYGATGFSCPGGEKLTMENTTDRPWGVVLQR